MDDGLADDVGGQRPAEAGGDQALLGGVGGRRARERGPSAGGARRTGAGGTLEDAASVGLVRLGLRRDGDSGSGCGSGSGSGLRGSVSAIADALGCGP